MSELQVWNFEEREVRTIDLDGNIWFVAKDVSEVLEYTATSRMLPLVDEDDRLDINPQDYPNLVQSLPDNTFRLSMINESGLYTVIMRSNKPEAKRFKRWVTSEVLPSIRRTGSYNSPAIANLEMQKMLVVIANDVRVLAATTEELRQLKQAASKHPGFMNIIEGEMEANEMIGLTVKTYCQLRGIKLSRQKAIQMGQIASAAYKIDKKSDPSKRNANPIYYGNDIRYLEEAFTKVTQVDLSELPDELDELEEVAI